MKAFPRLALVGALMLWATAFPLITISLRSFDPMTLAFARLALAGFLFVPLVVMTHTRLPRGRHLVRAALSGLLLLGGYSVFLNYGETHVDPALAGLLISVAPAFTVLFAARHGVRRAQLVAVALVLGGALIGAGNPFASSIDWPAAGCVVVAALCEAVALEIEQPLVRSYSPIALTAVGVWTSATALIAWLPATLADLTEGSTSSVTAAVFLGIGPTLAAYLLLAHATQELPTMIVTSSFSLLPLLSAVASWGLVGTSVNAALVVGAFVIAAGIALFARAEAMSAAAGPPLR